MKKRSPHSPIETAIAAASEEKRALITTTAKAGHAPSKTAIARIAELETKIFSLVIFRDLRAASEFRTTLRADARL
jgi:hypothetical protein